MNEYEVDIIVDQFREERVLDGFHEDVNDKKRPRLSRVQGKTLGGWTKFQTREARDIIQSVFRESQRLYGMAGK